MKTLYNCPHAGGRCQLHNNFLPFFIFPRVFFPSSWISIPGQTETGRAENIREESSLDVFLSIYCDVIYTDMKILYQSQKCSLLLTVISSPLLNLNSSLQNLKQKDVKYFLGLWITFLNPVKVFFHCHCLTLSKSSNCTQNLLLTNFWKDCCCSLLREYFVFGKNSAI